MAEEGAGFVREDGSAFCELLTLQPRQHHARHLLPRHHYVCTKISEIISKRFSFSSKHSFWLKKTQPIPTKEERSCIFLGSSHQRKDAATHGA